ncbi:MAG: hypothetical protein ACYSVY_18635, partial [Planctomycetota bacterium]
MSARVRRCCVLLTSLAVCLILSCTAGIGPGGAFVEFTIGGEVFTFTFGDLGIGRIRTEASTTTRATTTRTSLFEQVPTDTPPSGMVRLPNSSVGVFRRVTGKGIV